MKYKIEKNSMEDKTTWYIVREPITVIAEVFVKKDAELICGLLNFIHKKHNDEKKILSKLIVTTKRKRRTR